MTPAATEKTLAAQHAPPELQLRHIHAVWEHSATLLLPEEY
jgi:hypothetical protein